MGHIRKPITLRFTVEGPIVGINATYGRADFTKNRERVGFYKKKPAKEFAERIKAAAMAAKLSSDWPREPWLVEGVTISMRAFNDRHDSFAAGKLVADMFQDILYGDDKCVGWGEVPRPAKDEGTTRLEIEVRLDATRAADEARCMAQRAALKRENKTLRRKGLPTIALPPLRKTTKKKSDLEKRKAA